MKKVFLIIAMLFITISISSCKKLTNITDSDIDAIRDQTEVLKEQNTLIREQNVILTKIEQKMK